MLVVEQTTPLLLYSSKLGHSSRYCREYQYCDHASKLSDFDMTLRCWYVSRKSSACCSHHHLSTSHNTYSLLHLRPHIIFQYSIPAKAPPPSSETQALTTAEPSSIRRKSDWNSLPTQVIKLIVSRVDNLSTMPLAACSSGLYCLLIALRPELFKPAPCLLMLPDLQKRHVT